MNGPYSLAEHSVEDVDYTGPGPYSGLTPEERAKKVVDSLDLEQVIECIGGYKGIAFRGLQAEGIPSVWFTDATNGPRVYGPCTAMPSGLNLAATWNPGLASGYGRTVGEETRAYGAYVLLGPGVNIYRNPTGGRNFEYLGEDPLLAGIMAEEYIKAAQKLGAVCTIKHFVANNSDYDRHRCSSDIDERTLREIYLPAFERAVRKARVGAVMTAYNPVNGVYASANKELITDILRGEWGFDGFVMSDWLSLYDTVGPIKAGLDLEMPKAKWLSSDRVHAALEQGSITQEDLRAMVTRILATFFRLGVYDGPVQPTYNVPIGDPDHREIALQTAKEGIVLLKNGNSTSTQQDPMAPLPLEPKKTGHSRLMLAGPFQNQLPRGGGGSSLVRTPINTQVFTSELSNDLGSSVEILALSQPGAHLSSMGKGDTVMFLGGFDEDRQSEGYDRDWELPKKQRWQLARLRRLKRRQGFSLGVVLFSGGGVETESWIDEVDWLVWAGYPGQEGPEALSALLTCRDNFCGKLPFTMIRRWEDLPANHFYVDDPGSVSLHRVFLDQGRITKRQPWSMRYGEKQMVGYRAYAGWNTSSAEPSTLPISAVDKTPAFPFGFGLSYTQFVLSEAEINQRSQVTDPEVDQWDLQIEVQNTGDLPGKETIQVYIEDPNSSLPRPARSLAGFKKVLLPPGGKRKVIVSISLRDLAFYSPERKGWIAEKGVFRLHCGTSSADTKEIGEITLAESVEWGYNRG